MRRGFTHEVEAQPGVEINMSPLIDMVFLLLIFFVVTAVSAVDPGVEVQKPSALSATPVARDSLMLALTAEGEVVYGGRPLGLHAVRGVVARQIRELAVPVVILADARAPTGDLVALIDECKLAGAGSVSVATAPVEKTRREGGS